MHPQLFDLRVVNGQSGKIVRQLALEACGDRFEQWGQLEMRADGVVDLEQQAGPVKMA
jgi:hypothetical protein